MKQTLDIPSIASFTLEAKDVVFTNAPVYDEDSDTWPVKPVTSYGEFCKGTMSSFYLDYVDHSPLWDECFLWCLSCCYLYGKDNYPRLPRTSSYCATVFRHSGYSCPRP